MMMMMMIFWQLSRIKFSTRKLKEYYPHQSADSKNSASASGRIRRPHITALAVRVA